MAGVNPYAAPDPGTPSNQDMYPFAVLEGVPSSSRAMSAIPQPGIKREGEEPAIHGETAQRPAKRPRAAAEPMFAQRFHPGRPSSLQKNLQFPITRYVQPHPRWLPGSVYFGPFDVKQPRGSTYASDMSKPQQLSQSQTQQLRAHNQFGARSQSAYSPRQQSSQPLTQHYASMQQPAYQPAHGFPQPVQHQQVQMEGFATQPRSVYPHQQQMSRPVWQQQQPHLHQSASQQQSVHQPQQQLFQPAPRQPQPRHDQRQTPTMFKFEEPLTPQQYASNLDSHHQLLLQEPHSSLAAAGQSFMSPMSQLNSSTVPPVPSTQTSYTALASQSLQPGQAGPSSVTQHARHMCKAITGPPRPPPSREGQTLKYYGRPQHIADHPDTLYIPRPSDLRPADLNNALCRHDDHCLAWFRGYFGKHPYMITANALAALTGRTRSAVSKAEEQYLLARLGPEEFAVFRREHPGNNKGNSVCQKSRIGTLEPPIGFVPPNTLFVGHTPAGWTDQKAEECRNKFELSIKNFESSVHVVLGRPPAGTHNIVSSSERAPERAGVRQRWRDSERAALESAAAAARQRASPSSLSLDGTVGQPWLGVGEEVDPDIQFELLRNGMSAPTADSEWGF